MNLPPTQLDEVARIHRQRHGWSCAVSALEFAAKLHGLIPPDSFPLQDNPANQKLGFDTPDLQGVLGLQGQDGYYDTQSALDLIETETNQGRFPSVSLRAFAADGTLSSYHIFVAASKAGQPILIDPANGQVQTTTKEDLAKVLEQNSRNNPERATIHILTLHPKTKQG